MSSPAWWPRRWPPRRDVVSAACWTAAGVVLLAVGLYDRGLAHPALLLVPLGVAGAADLMRGVAPLLALAVGAAAVVGDALLGGSAGPWLILSDLLYAACLYGPKRAGRVLVRATVLLTLAAMVVALVAMRWAAGAPWRASVQVTVVVGMLVGMVAVAATVTGELIRYHRDQAAEHREHARQVARMADLDRRAAIVAERTRMARELHDVVAGHLTAVAVRSTAALRVAGDSPERLRAELGVVRGHSVAGLAEMRRMIGLLRAADGAAEDPTTSPGLAGVPALVAAATRDGLAVTSRLPDDDAVPLPVGFAAYRIVQESLTNALKHGGTGGTEVSVERAADRVTVTVTSPLPDRAPDTGAPGGGAGLIGMTERAELLGGTLSAGPVGARWIVRAELPVDPGTGP